MNPIAKYDYAGLIREWSELSLPEIKTKIDEHYLWKNHGISFLEKLSNAALIDFGYPQNLSILFIFDYCNEIINIEKNKIIAKAITESVQAKMIAWGTVALAVIAFVTLLLEICWHNSTTH